MFREQEVIGAVTYLAHRCTPVYGKAAQAVIAIENLRFLNELR
jgi:hypothetical protein